MDYTDRQTWMFVGVRIPDAWSSTTFICSAFILKLLMLHSLKMSICSRWMDVWMLNELVIIKQRLRGKLRPGKILNLSQIWNLEENCSCWGEQQLCYSSIMQSKPAAAAPPHLTSKTLIVFPSLGVCLCCGDLDSLSSDFTQIYIAWRVQIYCGSSRISGEKLIKSWFIFNYSCWCV